MKTSDFLKYPHNFHNEMPSFGKSDFSIFKIILISELWTNQPEVNDEVVRVKMKGKNLTTPYVIELKGKLILIDGHHTVIAKKLNGQTKIKAMFLKF